MSGDVAHLKSVRAGHKGVVTKKLIELQDALNATPLDNDQLEHLRMTFHEKCDIIKQLNNDIVALLTVEADIIAEVAAGDELIDSVRSALFNPLITIDANLRHKLSVITLP